MPNPSEYFSVPRELYRLKPERWLFDLALDWAVIVATFWVFGMFKSWWLAPFAALIIGARAHALGLLAHDGTHRVALKNPRLNDFMTEFFIAWPLFVAIDHGYRPWHFEHHRHLGSAHDPELDSYRGHDPYRDPVSWKRVALFFVTDLFGCGLPGLFKFLKAVFPKSKPQRILYPLLLWSAFFVICWQLDALWVFGLWAWGVVGGFWAVFRVRTWTEHVGLEWSGKETSHRFTPGPLARFLFFPHNTFCHYEHHKWPQVPYYNLPAVRALDQSRPVLHVSQLFPVS